MSTELEDREPCRVTKVFRDIHMAHRLMAHQGACRNLHGHSYRIDVTFEGLVNPRTGMVKDFGVIKKTVGAWIMEALDHALVLEKDDPLGDFLRSELSPVRDLKIMRMTLAPTAEHMAQAIGERWAGSGVVEVKVWETETSYATWTRDRIGGCRCQGSE